MRSHGLKPCRAGRRHGPNWFRVGCWRKRERARDRAENRSCGRRTNAHEIVRRRDWRKYMVRRRLQFRPPSTSSLQSKPSCREPPCFKLPRVRLPRLTDGWQPDMTVLHARNVNSCNEPVDNRFKRELILSNASVMKMDARLPKVCCGESTPSPQQNTVPHLFAGCHHDFNEMPGIRHVGLNASACGSPTFRKPGGPDGVHRITIADVFEPDLSL